MGLIKSRGAVCLKVLKIVGAVIGIVFVSAVIIFMPVILDDLFDIGVSRPIITTRFGHVDILLYIGAILLFFATEGVYNSWNSSELVLWPKTLARPRDNPYYTQLGVTFYAKASRENTIIREIEIHGFELRLESKKEIYYFADRLHCFENIIRPYLRVTATPVAENSYYAIKYGCDHLFSIQLHLCHFYENLVEIAPYSEMDVKVDIAYINNLGVRARGSQGFKVNALITETAKSQLLCENGIPLKTMSSKRVPIQHYLVNDWDICTCNAELTHERTWHN